MLPHTKDTVTINKEKTVLPDLTLPDSFIDEVTYDYRMQEVLEGKKAAIIELTSDELTKSLSAYSLREKLLRFFFNKLVAKNDDYILLLARYDHAEQAKKIERQRNRAFSQKETHVQGVLSELMEKENMLQKQLTALQEKETAFEEMKKEKELAQILTTKEQELIQKWKDINGRLIQNGLFKGMTTPIKILSLSRYGGNATVIDALGDTRMISGKEGSALAYSHYVNSIIVN